MQRTLVYAEIFFLFFLLLLRGVHCFFLQLFKKSLCNTTQCQLPTRTIASSKAGVLHGTQLPGCDNADLRAIHRTLTVTSSELFVRERSESNIFFSLLSHKLRRRDCRNARDTFPHGDSFEVYTSYTHTVDFHQEKGVADDGKNDVIVA